MQVYSGRLKEDVPVKDESRRWWEAMLRRLAWVMTTEGEKTELRVTIEKREAEQVLREYLTEQEVPDAGGCAKIWLEDLLKHHLLQVEAGEHLAFRHQMIQEYYAAEELLERLPELSDEEFKQEYLNYLKWTEAIALMLGLLRDEKQALRAIELAKEVDLCLAARLSGKVLPAFQEKTVEWVKALDVGAKLKVLLLDLTKSEAAIPGLMEALKHPDVDVRRKAARAVRAIASEAAIPALVQTLKDPDSEVRRNGALSLGEMNAEIALNESIEAIEEQDREIRRALEEIDDRASIAKPYPVRAMNSTEIDRDKISSFLAGIGSILEIMPSRKPDALEVLNELDRNLSIDSSLEQYWENLGVYLYKIAVELIEKPRRDEDEGAK